MPQLDGTGPQGKGPRTGRGLGRCEGAKPTKRGFGMGRGRGFGRGFGFRRSTRYGRIDQNDSQESQGDPQSN